MSVLEVVFATLIFKVLMCNGVLLILEWGSPLILFVGFCFLFEIILCCCLQSCHAWQQCWLRNAHFSCNCAALGVSLDLAEVEQYDATLMGRIKGWFVEVRCADDICLWEPELLWRCLWWRRRAMASQMYSQLWWPWWNVEPGPHQKGLNISVSASAALPKVNQGLSCVQLFSRVHRSPI